MTTSDDISPTYSASSDKHPASVSSTSLSSALPTSQPTAQPTSQIDITISTISTSEHAKIAAPHNSPWLHKRYRNRHGRGMRRAMFGMRMPYYRTATGYFDDQVAVAIRTIKRRHPDLLTKIECAVEDVPPSDPLAWEEYSASLSQSFPASHGVPARIALYRKPIEARAHHRIELQLIIREELVRQIAALTGMYPEDIDPSWNM